MDYVFAHNREAQEMEESEIPESHSTPLTLTNGHPTRQDGSDDEEDGDEEEGREDDGGEGEVFVEVVTPSHGGGHGHGGLEEGSGMKISYRQKLLRTAIVAASYFSLSAALAVLPPTVIDIEQYTGTSTQQTTFLFVARAGGGLVGAVLMGAIFDHLNHLAQLSTALLLCGTFTIIVPFCANFIPMLIVIFGQGIFINFIDCAGAVMCLYIWGSENAPYTQVVHFIDGIGNMISPLIVAPFLYHHNVTNDVSNLSTNQSSISVISHNSTPRTLDTFEFDTNRTRGWEEEPEFSYKYAYVIVGCISFAIALVVIFIWLYLERTLVADKGGEKSEEEEEDDTSEDGVSKRERHLTTLLVVLMSVTQFLQNGVEDAYQSFLVTYAVKALGWTTTEATHMDSLHYGAFTCGGAIGILISNFISAAAILWLDVVVMVMTFTAELAFSRSYPLLLWGSCVVAGLSLSTLAASNLSWMENHVKMNSKITSILYFAGILGMITIPGLTGIMMDKISFIMFPVVQLVTTLLSAITFAASIYIGRQMLAQRQLDEPSNCSEGLVTDGDKYG